MKRSTRVMGMLLLSLSLGGMVGHAQTPPPPLVLVINKMDTRLPPTPVKLSELHRQGYVLVTIIPLPDGGFRSYFRNEAR